MKGSNENAYGELTDAAYGDVRFYDPISSPGNWNNTSVFANIHTQSTRSFNTNSGCFSGGGMDDRFDMILMSGQVIEDTGLVSYVPGSYYALGQDGQHFNQELIAGGNNAAPAEVITALYEMSDHLPVVAEVSVRQQEPVINGMSRRTEQRLRVFQNGNELSVGSLGTGHSEVRLLNLHGTVLEQHTTSGSDLRLSLAGYPAGVYILNVQRHSRQESFKVIHLR